MKILVVVDMQNDFIDGSLGTPEAQAIVPKVVKTIEDYADKGYAILFTKDTHEENYMETLEGKNLPVPHCIRGTEGHNINKEVYNAYLRVANKYKCLKSVLPNFESDIIEKPTFGSMDLQDLLYAVNTVEPIEEVAFIGLCTGICVLSNAILTKATLLDTNVNVIADCCACVSPVSHTTALQAMELCQINII